MCEWMNPLWLVSTFLLLAIECMLFFGFKLSILAVQDQLVDLSMNMWTNSAFTKSIYIRINTYIGTHLFTEMSSA